MVVIWTYHQQTFRILRKTDLVDKNNIKYDWNENESIQRRFIAFLTSSKCNQTILEEKEWSVFCGNIRA